MKLRKIVSLVLAVIMIGSCTLTAFAADTPEKQTFNYVALGDSIAAGFGLENESGSFFGDPSLFLTEDLIANPIRSAYPALYGEKLTALGEDNGYEMIATNLSTCGYLAEDVEKTILEDNHKGAMMQSILRMTGNTENDPMENYHEIFSQYIPDADLVSIQLGGNDIILSMFRTVGKSDNPIVEAVRTSVMMSLLGTGI
jgi:lysophospholipase L1-like esterase